MGSNWEVIGHEGRTYDLLLAIFWARDEVYGFHVSHVDFVTQDVREDDLGYISVL